MRILIYYIVVFTVTISCQVKKKNQDLGIIESIPFSKESYYKYDNGYLRPDPRKMDSFKSYIYTIVEPFEENKSLPKKVYDSKRWKKSINYFEKELKGKNLSFLEINNKIVLREFYIDYKAGRTDSSDKITNLSDLKEYLKNKQLSYTIIKHEKTALADVVDIDIERKFYRIILNRSLCQSYLFYNKKDTLNFNLYSNNLSLFYQ